MGVMACSRADCPKIMCDRMVDGTYICDDCLAELERYRAGWMPPLTAVQVRARVRLFMATVPGSYIGLNGQDEIEAVFREMIR